MVRTVSGADHHVIVPPPRPLQSGAYYAADAIAEMAEHGATIHHVPMERDPVHLANLAALPRILAIVRRARASVLHGHSSAGGALARLVARPAGIPVLYTPNGLADGRVSRAAERALGRLTTRMVAVSESEARDAAQLGLCPPDRIVVVPNGIDVTASSGGPDLRESLKLSPGTPLVGTIARLVHQKAPEQFVEICAGVAALHPDAHFLLIGAGPLQSEVEASVLAHHLGDRWHQIEFLPNASAVMDQLDVFVLASRFEGGPYAPLEAMRAGTPVVLSDVVGNRDSVEDGVSGRVLPFGATAEMARAVADLLDDPERRAAMSEAGRARLESRFDVRLMGQALGAVYAEVVDAATRRRTRKLPQPSPPSSVQDPESSASL